MENVDKSSLRKPVSGRILINHETYSLSYCIVFDLSSPGCWLGSHWFVTGADGQNLFGQVSSKQSFVFTVWLGSNLGVQLQSLKVEHWSLLSLHAGLLENQVLQLIFCIGQAQVTQGAHVGR